MSGYPTFDVPGKNETGARSTLHPVLRVGLWSTLAVGSLVLWFAGLNLRPLGEPDEGRYAEVAREMFVTGDWLTPRLDGFNFFDKPALQYWASAFFYGIFGVHEWSARIWVALTGLLAIVAVGWAGSRLYGRRTGWTAALVLGSSLLFVAGAHIGTIDVGVAAFLSIAICFFLVAQFDPVAQAKPTRFNLIGWACLGLAVLSKGLIGFVLPAATLAVFMLWERDWSILRRMTIGWGLLLALLIAAPWFIAVSLKHPDFLEYFFIKQQFSRFVANVFDRERPWWFFIPVVLGGLFPWVAFLPFSRAGLRSLHKGAPADRFLVCWIAVVFVFFSVSHSKLPFYILPIFPALAMLIARRLSMLSAVEIRRRLLWVAALAAAFAVLALLLPLSTRHLSQHTDLHPALVWLTRGLGALAIVSAISAYLVARQNRPTLMICLLGFSTLLVWQTLFASVGNLAGSLSAAPVAKLMLPALHDDTEVFTVHAYVRGLPFYLGRLVTVADEDTDDIRPGIASRPNGFVASVGAFEQRWRDAPSAIAVIDPALMPQLKADGLPMEIIGQAPIGTIVQRPTSASGASP
ncbi:phospholipid carrier-dependent glycosyltransferase [Rhodanobacter sp. BL-MT-08]